MKRIIYLVIAIWAVLLFFSCGDNFLDTEPKGTASETVMSEAKGVEALLIAAYDVLNGTGAWNPGWEMIMGSIYSDDCYWGGEFLPREVGIYQMTPNIGYTIRRWQNKYDGVARANDVLRFLQENQKLEGKNKIPQQRALQIEAEAKFLRAHYHFFLQRSYWQIPYIKTSEEMGGLTSEQIPNDSDVWDEIEADFQFAIDNLPEEPIKGEVGRVTKFAAMTAKVHAHMEQMELNEAKPLLDAIIVSNKFELVDNYMDNYLSSTEHNIESIFELEGSVGDASNGGNAIWELNLAGHQKGPAAVGWGQYQPTINLFNAFQVTSNGLPVLNVSERDSLGHDNGIESFEEFIPTDHPIDPRCDWTISRRGIPFLDWGICEGKSWIREQDYGGPFMTKKLMHYKWEPSNSNGSRNARNIRFYRYAHVLLWRAEIHVEDGEFEQARQLVNKIRIRAKNEVVMGKCNTYVFDGRDIEVDWDQPAANYSVEPYPVSHVAFNSKELARETVRHEFRMEFATEGLRFFQLRRWGIEGEVLNNFMKDDLTHKRRNRYKGITYDPVRDNYWPLPQPQLDLQPEVLQQDPDWK